MGLNMAADGWSLWFFLGAIDVFAAGVIAVVCMIIKIQPAMFTFTSELFLLVFGFIMLISDFPLNQCGRPDKWKMTVSMKKSIFKFMLFLTRFTGRGLWYMFLGTMV